MKKFILILSGIILIYSNIILYAKEPSFTQLFYVTRQIFPEAEELIIFLSNEQLSAAKTKINRASAQSKFKSKVYIIENSTMIGQSVQKLPKQSILLIMSSDVLMKNSNKLYILSKCKEKQIAIISPTREYSESGALVGIISNAENNKLDLVLNLKHNEQFKSKFTAELIQKLDIQEVIQ